MRIVLIGSGNVATVLGRRFIAAGHTVEQVYSRTHEHALKLAAELNGTATDEFSKIIHDADLYVVALTDTILYDLGNLFKLKKGLLVHTAGSVPMQVLEASASNHGVLYPLQSLRKDMKSIPEIPFLVEANTADDLCLLEELAHTLSIRVTKTDSESRLKLHIAAVMVSNFTNMLYAVTEDYCQEEGLDFMQLKPLITETANRLGEHAAKDLQTGPAVRNDVSTIEKHLSRLTGTHPEMAALYANLSKATSDWFSKKRG